MTEPAPPPRSAQARIALLALALAWIAGAALGWPLTSSVARVVCAAGFAVLVLRSIRGRVRTRALAVVLTSPGLFLMTLFDNMASAAPGLGMSLIGGMQLLALAGTAAAGLAIAWADGEHTDDQLPAARIHRR